MVVVLDQLSSWVLARDLSALPEDGAIRRTIARGVYHHEVVYPFAATITAPGHASIATGVTPSEHGIFANKIWNRATRSGVAIVDDGEHPIHGHPSKNAGPGALRVDTVGDALHAATGGRGHVVSLSLKDRSAVLLGGRRPSAVLFFDKRSGSFTTSTYYASEIPAWVTAFEQARPIAGDLATWTPLDAALLTARAPSPDSQPGEGDWEGLGTVFPHEPSRTRDPLETFLATPGSTDRLLGLAAASIDAHALGADADPDLLMISVSGTDYVGHVFGPDSWEWLDNLLRVDRALTALMARFADREDVALMITSDHGVAPLPEVSRAAGHEAFRLLASTVLSAADAAIDRQLGAGDWAVACEFPYIYLSDAARTPEHRDRARAAAIAGISAIPGVGGVFDVDQARGDREHADPIRRAVALSIPTEIPADLMVLPAERSSTDEEMPPGTGTSHGSPYPIETHVPVIFAGPGVTALDGREPVDQRRVAPTISALLGVPPPSTARAEPLPGAPR